MVRFWAAQALGRFKDARAVETLVAALKDGNLEIIAGAYSFFIARGENGTEVLLINALNAHGFSQMAEDFLNSNNALLSEAALQWAKNNGYIIRYGTSSNSSGWGSNP